ncbi:MAG: globin [Planctomycetota bacterium]
MSDSRDTPHLRQQDPVGWIIPERGEDGLRAVVRAFYRRIPTDDLLGPMYPAEDLAGAEQRLADFLVERCGGEPYFTRERGHPRLRMRHARFAIDEAARDRWLRLMREAIAEVGREAPELRVDEEMVSALDSFLEHVADFLRNRA